MEKVVWTMQDQLILSSYQETVLALACYLGDAYEIVLYSLEDPEHAVLQIANGFHTGEKVGDPLPDIALHWLEKLAAEPDCVSPFSYFAKNKLGEPLKSSTIPIHGTAGTIIGLLCINLYLGTPAIHLISDLLPKELSVFSPSCETTPYTVEQEIAHAQEQVLMDPSIPSQLQKKEIIRILHRRKVFEIKNSVEQVANALELSINTVYFHLRKIAKEE